MSYPRTQPADHDFLSLHVNSISPLISPCDTRTGCPSPRSTARTRLQHITWGHGGRGVMAGAPTHSRDSGSADGPLAAAHGAHCRQQQPALQQPPPLLGPCTPGGCCSCPPPSPRGSVGISAWGAPPTCSPGGGLPRPRPVGSCAAGIARAEGLQRASPSHRSLASHQAPGRPGQARPGQPTPGQALA